MTTSSLVLLVMFWHVLWAQKTVLYCCFLRTSVLMFKQVFSKPVLLCSQTCMSTRVRRGSKCVIKSPVYKSRIKLSTKFWNHNHLTIIYLSIWLQRPQTLVDPCFKFFLATCCFMHLHKYNLAISGHDTKPVSFFDDAEIGSGLLEGVCTSLWLKQAEVLSATLSCFWAGADCLCMCGWPYMSHFLCS